MNKFIYAPKGSDFDSDKVGGFNFDAIIAYEYIPKGGRMLPSSDPREDAFLKIAISEKQEFYFFGKVADCLISQIEEVARRQATSLT